MESIFECPRCGNKDPKYVGIRNGKPYCRKCVNFLGKEAIRIDRQVGDVDIYLGYSLSKEQQNLSNELLKNFLNGQNSFVSAVCGSGKTEIVLQVIQYCLSVGYRCGFAVPRRDVAKELYDRFKQIFTTQKVVLVCGGSTKKLEGDLIILTTHQLFRYNDYFHLLILDEMDAFPYKGSSVLYSLFLNSVKMNYIMMSATPEDSFLLDFGNRGGKVLKLNSRYHKYPLPVPSIIVLPMPVLKIRVLHMVRKYVDVGKQVFIFTPTISECENLESFLRKGIKEKGTYVHSKRANRAKIINDFRKKAYSYLVTTAVLERGVTVPDLQVIVFHADHSIYDKYSLIQIAGRVGRKAFAPTGDVVYAATKITKDMEESIESIETSNKDMQNLF